MGYMCKLYKQLTLLIENKVSCLKYLEELQTTNQDNWETCYCDKLIEDDSYGEESGDKNNN